MECNFWNQITVIIPVRNRDKARILRCINSFKNWDIVSEVIIVDYASDKPVKLSGKKIKVIRTENNYFNKSHALNLGIKQSRSDYMLQ